MNGWVNNAIELSSNNKGDTVSITFSFNTSKAVSAGYLFVTFPASFGIGSPSAATGFSVASATAANTLKFSPFTCTAGGDNVVTISGLTNPSTEGGYGPFGLQTRLYENG